MTNPQRYPLVLQPLAEQDGGGWLATFPDLPGCMGDDETPAAAIEDAYRAARAWLDVAAEAGDRVPAPGALGRFVAHPKRSHWLALAVALINATGFTTPTLAQTATADAAPLHRAPPEQPVVLERAPGPVARTAPWAALQSAEPLLHAIGSPTDAEQLYVELINRARADADAEALRLAQTTDPDLLSVYAGFAVDLDLFIAQMATQPSPTPPLAIDATLTEMARLHSLDQHDNLFQGHVSSANPPAPFSPGADLASRAQAMGYDYQRLAENVYAFAKSERYGHAGFVVDWGYGTGGMQEPPGHRNTIHSPDYREVGVGVVINSDPSRDIGPQIVTQNFGTRFGAAPMITGVAYFDLDGDGFYGLGEGLGQVEVSVAGSGYYAVTADSGGYAVPVPGNGDYAVTFRATGMPDEVQSVTITDGENRKLDLPLVYTPPAISGTPSPLLGAEHAYGLSGVPGTTNYQIEMFAALDGAVAEGAEPAERAVSITSAGGYDVIQSAASYSGDWAFHLAHALGEGGESVQLNALFFVADDSATLQFASRLGVATDAQVAAVEVSTDAGLTWQRIYAQPGSGQPGETAFVVRTLSLGAFAGAFARIRFVYDFDSGSYYPQSSPNVGWLIDEILLTGVRQVISSELVDLGTEPSFTYAPTATGNVILWRGRAQNGARSYPFGPTVEIAPVAAIGTHCDDGPVTMLGTTYPPGTHALRSADRIETRGPVVVADGAELTYTSPAAISLGPGFSVSRGGQFAARIAAVACQSD
jgi:predicted RNase H-like HicB family nuclease